MARLGSDRSIQPIASPGLDVPFSYLVVCLMGEGVGFHRVSSQLVNQSEVESCEPEGPTGLPTVQILGRSEVHEVPVVIQDLYCILSPF